MLSKFAGIKVISELRSSSRIKLIITLIVIAEVALLLFGIVPHPYNFIFLFINGLPLGMVYGIVFSFLEGRRFTEMIAMGLSVSVIVASGILKTIYLEVHAAVPFVSEFWMPFFMGMLFLPFFFLFVWMLKLIPEPSASDRQLRSERIPMNEEDKRNALKEFGFPIVCFIICYSMLATVRDYRDNFSIEIWNEIDAGWPNSVLSTTEMICGFIVFVVIGSLSFIKSNAIGFRFTNVIILAGILLSGLATLLFKVGLIGGFSWMLLIGVGMVLAYTAIQTVLFERMIALFQLKANAGFFVYICDSIGYLGSVGLLLFKEFFMHDIRWSELLIEFLYLQTIFGLVLLGLAILFFQKRTRRIRLKQKETASIIVSLKEIV
jgi:MFS family permease